MDRFGWPFKQAVGALVVSIPAFVLLALIWAIGQFWQWLTGGA